MAKIAGLFLMLLLVGAANTNTQAASAEQSFYKGKTIRIIVGFAAGGGFDAYARAIARNLSRHIPGNPAVIVDNMTGAGSRIAANYLYKAPPDGLIIGNFIGSLVLQQIMGDKSVEFDGRKFEWLGVPVQDETVCGANDSDAPRILKAALGLPIQLIEGFKGTSNIRIAAEAGEVDGGCWTWASIRTTWSKGLESGLVKPIIQINPKKAADIPNVLIESGTHAPSAILRAYAVAPGTPKERINTLRTAFNATMKDPEFVAEMDKSKLEINPLSGSEMESIVKKLFGMDAANVAKIREVLVPKN
ncbi:MAG: tripartite tricarboxylate transporter family receptor [Deltaproteobacteria bacterium]|nr:tripartite tricarboxylate transporter family receptor [Deltaproteobacteria bacterium]